MLHEPAVALGCGTGRFRGLLRTQDEMQVSPLRCWTKIKKSLKPAAVCVAAPARASLSEEERVNTWFCKLKKMNLQHFRFSLFFFFFLLGWGCCWYGGMSTVSRGRGTLNTASSNLLAPQSIPSHTELLLSPVGFFFLKCVWNWPN